MLAIMLVAVFQTLLSMRPAMVFRRYSLLIADESRANSFLHDAATSEHKAKRIFYCNSILLMLTVLHVKEVAFIWQLTQNYRAYVFAC